MPPATRYDVAIAGGGPIGLAAARRLAQDGATVAVVDPAPGSGASDVAAGMLAPVTEAHYGESELLRLNLASATLYPDFVGELEVETGLSVDYRACGTLTVAFDAGDRAAIDDLVDYHRSLGLEASSLTGRQARALEPLLASGTTSGALAPGDHQVDPRLLTTALLASCHRRGVSLVLGRAEAVLSDGEAAGGFIVGSRPEDAGSPGTVAADHVVVAAGSWSRMLVADLEGIDLPVRPVKGQILTLASSGHPSPVDRSALSHNLRCLVEGRTAYLVPRHDGRIVLGATAEEKGFDTTVTADALYDLLRAARLAVPATAEMEVIEMRAGLRPGTPDNAPLIGPTGLPGLYAATGHYRNGILLTPVTAEILADQIGNRPPRPGSERYSPLRFTRQTASTAGPSDPRSAGRDLRDGAAMVAGLPGTVRR